MRDIALGVDRGDEPTVGRYRDGKVARVRGTSQLAHERTAGCVPDLHGAVVPRSHDPRAIGAVSGLVDRLAVEQHEQPPIGLRVPDLRGLVVGRDDLTTVWRKHGRPHPPGGTREARLLREPRLQRLREHEYRARRVIPLLIGATEVDRCVGLVVEQLRVALVELGLPPGRLRDVLVGAGLLLSQLGLLLGQLGLQRRLTRLHRRAVQHPADHDRRGEPDERPPEPPTEPRPPQAVHDERARELAEVFNLFQRDLARDVLEYLGAPQEPVHPTVIVPLLRRGPQPLALALLQGPTQIGGQGHRALLATAGELGERHLKNALDLARNAIREMRHEPVPMQPEEFVAGIRRERHIPGQRLVGQNAERVDVGPRTDLVCVGPLLRGHICVRAQTPPGGHQPPPADPRPRRVRAGPCADTRTRARRLRLVRAGLALALLGGCVVRPARR